MGNYFGGYVQVKKDDVTNGDEATQHCLRNPLIVRQILEHFSRPELLQLSFVNKLWKCEAQSVMRMRGELTVYLKSYDYDPFHPNEPVDAFVSALKQMNPAPFSGINIDICFRPGIPTFPILAMDPLQDIILAQPLLKTASVKFHGSWLENMASPAFLLAKKVMQDSSGGLQELELCIDFDREHFLQNVVQDFTFPRLKILKLREVYCRPCEAGYANYMKVLVSRAPNLEVLHSSWSINLMLRVLEGSSVLPVYGSCVDAPFDEISEDAVSAIRLENMKLSYAGPEFNLQRFNRITPMLLEQSCATTLHSMNIDAVLAIPLMSFGIRLENVKNLWMDINFSRLEHFEPRILRIIKNFNFNHIFPKLDKVKIVSFNMCSSLAPNHMNGIIEQANAILNEPTPDRAVNVKTLDLNQMNISSEAAHFFSHMFPSIEKLAMDSHGSAPIPFESIRNWLDLKELEVRGNVRPIAGNLDSVFCGIFPEEVADLRLKDEEYLMRVNIVPVMPAVTGLRKLRSLSLYHKDLHHVPLDDDDATFLFSKVTALLAFARQPALAVSLHISAHRVPPAMTHLKPYVSVTTDLLRRWSTG